MSKILVTKRSGRREPLNEDKAMLPLIWSCENLSGVSASQIAMKSKIQFYDGITTKEIHEVYVKTAADLISEDSPNYQYVAGRLAVFGFRKEAYGQFEPPSVKSQVERVTALGFYDEDLLASYDDDEWSALDRMVQHSSD